LLPQRFKTAPARPQAGAGLFYEEPAVRKPNRFVSLVVLILYLGMAIFLIVILALGAYNLLWR
jgi:hypothetical protein